ncbi:MAG: SDR family oxidoreductase [bacterium]
MNLGIKGKRALVTGASSGLGKAAALALAAEGVIVTINSRTKETLEKAAALIEKETGNRPNIAVGDISISDNIKEIIKSAGDVDILVSNTGGPPPGDFSGFSQQDWANADNLILNSAINLTRAVIESMKTKGWGRLIYITSVAVLQPIDDLILSNTYRAGLTGFCKTISNKYAKFGITANTVCPGYTGTERLWHLAESRAAQSEKTKEEVMQGFGSVAPVGRVGKPEELASLITYLSSIQAAYITGASIPVDGGLYKSLI